MPFRQAKKEEFSLKLAIAGIAGSGKTFTSFKLASLLAGSERFAVIDVENRKARIYADIFKFDVLDLDIYTLAAYTKAVREAEEAGYKALVIDGLTPLWEGKNGIKDMVEMIARRDRITTFAAWQQGNNLLADFAKMLIDSNMHIICTLRSKIEYSNDTNKDGKLQYRRSGLAPIFKENFEYEFPVYIEMDHEHRGTFYKSMCSELDKKVLQLADAGEVKRLISILKKWMAGEPGTTPPAPPPARTEKEQEAAPQTTEDEPATETQTASIQKLYERLGRVQPEGSTKLSYTAAKELIARLSQEYQEQRRAQQQK
jgi:hypothetical protein